MISEYSFIIGQLSLRARKEAIFSTYDHSPASGDGFRMELTGWEEEKIKKKIAARMIRILNAEGEAGQK